MLNSLMEGSRQICHWKHQQPQIYALLEAALESMHNHTVVQVHYVTVKSFIVLLIKIIEFIPILIISIRL